MDMISTILNSKHSPRWVVLVIDIFISFFSISIAYSLRFNFLFPSEFIGAIYTVIPFVILIRFLSFVISKTYAGIVRYTSTSDAIRIFTVVSAGSGIFALCNLISFYFVNGRVIIPLSILIIDYFVTVFLMTSSRFFVKTIYLEFKHLSSDNTNVAIFGVDEFALTTKRVLERDAGTNFNVIAYIDDNSKSAGKKLDGINIYHIDDLEDVMEKHFFSNLIIAKNLKPQTKTAIIDTCLNYNVKVLTVPSANDWINGELSFKQIRKVNIEDLLERDPIKLDEKQIRKETLNKTILVTGAAGSIGSEIVRQLTKFFPKKIIVFDQAESPLYDLELELREKCNFFDFEVVIGSITNMVRVNKVFEVFRPDVVYHAAAYKHVPMQENNPSEAVHTNVLGTRMIADFSVKFGVQKFVMVSTDKAVRPTNVMGASKRIAEIYIQSLNKVSTTKFITTRFGNVLGSNGSVIPRFKSQIEKGGPVTITHPDVTRFFMTIPEACQLVLEASAFGKGGEIFIFDMGKSVKIVDLAKKMIRLSGLTLGKDINLNFTGLRPGEKLYEELLNDQENTMPTHHSRIMIANVQEYDFEEVEKEISFLISTLRNHNNFEIVGLMKKIVPDFKSQNSEYEELDNEDVLQRILKNIKVSTEEQQTLDLLVNETEE